MRAQAGKAGAAPCVLSGWGKRAFELRAREGANDVVEAAPAPA
jgi:hypothetical protein